MRLWILAAVAALLTAAPAQAAPPLEAYSALPMVRSVPLSPSGEHNPVAAP